jgi:hypothetical protein
MLMTALAVGCVLLAAWLVVLGRSLSRRRLEREALVTERLAEAGSRLRQGRAE